MNAEIKPFFNGSEIAHLRATEAALVEDAKKTGDISALATFWDEKKKKTVQRIREIELRKKQAYEVN